MNLNPEKSYNINVNYIKKFFSKKGSYLGLDASLWYGYFTNKIVADYEANSNLILYQNLNGYAETKGMTMNLDAILKRNLTIKRRG